MTATLPTTAVPELFHVCMPALPQTTSHGLLYDHEKDDYENKEHILHGGPHVLRYCDEGPIRTAPDGAQRETRRWYRLPAPKMRR
jgi:hypothetical protein